MARKKWTANEEITEELLRSREKRKWQQALRRYVLEKNISEGYATYFGLSIISFREWIEMQFTTDLNWENFGTEWQFDHILPISYFDFGNEEDLKLCWNFLNIRVDKHSALTTSSKSIDILAVNDHFELLYLKTGYAVCGKMLDKIKKIKSLSIIEIPIIESFLISMKEEIAITASLTQDEFSTLNKGTSLTDIVLEREILKRFG